MSMSRTVRRFNGSWFKARADERYAAIVVNCLVRAHCGGKLPRFQRPKSYVMVGQDDLAIYMKLMTAAARKVASVFT